MRRWLFGLAVVSALAAGCHDNSYMSASVTNQKGDPAAVIDFKAAISIPEGSAATADIALISHSNKVLSGDIQSGDPTVLRILRLTTDPSGYAFLGSTSGKTSVLVTINGQQVQSVSATVVAPPTSSLPPTVDAGIPSVTTPEAGAPEAALPEAAP